MQKKQGISLIVLVITIIVMIILAASVVITLSNTGVINRASQAADLTNEASVQDLAALIWADAYMDKKRGEELVNEVTTKLGEQGVTADKWNISVTDTGVTVTLKESGDASDDTSANIITFYLHIETDSSGLNGTDNYCEAEEGMTWGEWVNSKYNTLEVTIESGAPCINGNFIKLSGVTTVSSADVIIADGGYGCEFYHGGTPEEPELD